MRVVQLDAVTVARIELIENLLFDARWRETQPAIRGQLLGTCIHHAGFSPASFSTLSSVLPIAIPMVLATFRALLMTTTGFALLSTPNDLCTRARAVLLPSLTTKADDEGRLAPSALPLGPVHLHSLQRASRKLVLSREAGASCDPPFDRAEGPEFPLRAFKFSAVRRACRSCLAQRWWAEFRDDLPSLRTA